MMLLREGTQPFPLIDEIWPGEDGVGYALRMATRNALTFHQLASHLASPGHRYLPNSAASELAFMFGASTLKVANAIVARHRRGNVVEAEFLSHTFHRAKHLRQAHPQVCPLCLQEGGHARASWSITLVCCCTVHKTALIDRCGCGRTLSWRRKNLQTCECGSDFLDHMQVMQPAPRGALAICKQIETLLGFTTFRLHPESDWISRFDAISVDTFLRLIWILGNRASTKRPSIATASNGIVDSNTARQITEAAYDELKQLANGRILLRSTMRTAIEAIRQDATTAPDRQLLDSLLLRIPRPIASGRVLAGRRSVQLALFE